jgi:hypothetical protein
MLLISMSRTGFDTLARIYDLAGDMAHQTVRYPAKYQVVVV